MNVVEIKNVSKKYDLKTVVNSLSLDLKKGECFGFLGPNGAGKSTTMKMLSCEILPTNGDIFILGLNTFKNPVAVKRKIGIVPQDDGLDTDFNVIDNLLLFASYYNIDEEIAYKRSVDLLRTMRLEEQSDKTLEALSGGMKRRLAIARGLINNPEIVLLDEPTTGLDPQARIWLWDYFQTLKKNDITLILTTHYMEEAEKICDRIAIMDHGKILAIGTPKDLIKNHIGYEVVELQIAPNEVSYFVNKLNSLNIMSNNYGDTLSVFLRDKQTSKFILDLIPSAKVQIRLPTLNDVFLKLAGHNLREDN